jgi:hypothetical protein
LKPRAGGFQNNFQSHRITGSDGKSAQASQFVSDFITASCSLLSNFLQAKIVKSISTISKKTVFILVLSKKYLSCDTIPLKEEEV